MQYLKQEHSECPNIGLRAVYAVDKSLRSHISRRADTDILEFLLAMRCETEISYLCIATCKQDIGSFDVTMYYAHGLQIKQALENIFNDCVSIADVFFFSKVSLLESI